MKMLVETFEVEESTDEMALMAADSDGIDLIEKLGLSGQKRFVDSENVVRFPYRKMTKDEALVYGMLCPKQSQVENYSDGIMPLRILQIVAHARELNFLDGMTVW